MSIITPPSDIVFGYVVGRIVRAIADSADADSNPDFIPADGTVTFRPLTTIQLTTSYPATVIKEPIVCTISQTTGEILDAQRNPGVWLVAGNYEVSFKLGTGTIPPFNVSVSTDHTKAQPLDLTLAAPLVPSPTVKFVVNEQIYKDTLDASRRAEQVVESVDQVILNEFEELKNAGLLTGPQGVQGPAGPVNTIVIGDVSSGSQASASITGTSPNQELNLVLEPGPAGPRGETGPQGIQGIQGPEGLQGKEGPQGIQGPIGPTGLTGDTGPQGLTGPEGPVGPQGEVGPQGPEGPVGEKGETGPQGPTGAGLALKDSLESTDDLPATGDLGDAYLISGDLWVWDTVQNSFINSGNIQGPEGKVGPEGPPGPKGDQGEAGPAGPEGPRGIQGVDGPAGPQGLVGPQGPTGPEGPKGETGLQGPEGPQGIQGIQGEPGPEGSVGPEGPKGDAGPAGVVISETQPTNGEVWIDPTDEESLDLATVAFSGEYSDLIGTPNIPVIEEEPIVDLVSNLQNPIIVSHRGGALVYPEESMRALRASVESGFYPEVDVQFLKDGTPVCVHDSTANRTMSGVTGNISNITLQQWKSAKIKPIYPGGREESPLLFSEFLDEFGGQYLLFPEIKPGGTTTEVDRVIQMVEDRKLNRAVVLQSFDYATCQRIASHDIPTMFLMGETFPAGFNPGTAYQDGIGFAGPSKHMSAALMTQMKNAGMKVIPYTTYSAKEATDTLAKADGYFSDDPWGHSGKIMATGAPTWTYGEGWPAVDNVKTFTAATGGAITRLPANTLEIRGGSLYVPYTTDTAMISIGLEHLTGGPISRPVMMQMTFQFLRAFQSSGSNVGFHFMRNNPGVLLADKAQPGQNGLTFARRRNGELKMWEYINGAAATSIGTSVTGATSVADGEMSPILTYNVEIGTSNITISSLDGTPKSYSGTSSLTGTFTPYLRIVGSECLIHNVQIRPL